MLPNMRSDLKIILPQLGEGIEKATVAVWHFKVGDEVREDDDIVEVVTDKATFNVPAGAKGKLEQVCAAEGCEVAVGATLGIIAPSGR